MSEYRLPRGLEFVRLLGAGGFGYVVLARDPNLSRLVAVKCVYGGAHAGDSVSRMLREGRALAALKHPGVLPIFEATNVGADVVLIMEYAQGGDLEHAVQLGQLPVATRLGILQGVAEALDVVHARGVIHRDLKPANIVLTADLSPKIADFGLARLTADASAFRTDLGVVSGTPEYAAPEQLASPELETPQLDWYSFGVIAHRVMCGALPGSLEPPAQAKALFAAALAEDPRFRTPPQTLVAQLRSLPADLWPKPTGSRQINAQPTAGATSASRNEVPEAVLVPTVLGSDALLSQRPTELPDSWVEVPVFRPAGRSLLAKLLPLAIGLSFGLIVAVFLLTR